MGTGTLKIQGATVDIEITRVIEQNTYSGCATASGTVEGAIVIKCAGAAKGIITGEDEGGAGLVIEDTGRFDHEACAGKSNRTIVGIIESPSQGFIVAGGNTDVAIGRGCTSALHVSARPGEEIGNSDVASALQGTTTEGESAIDK